MNISNEGISLIKRFEGCELEAYKCAAGVWTIGYGSTKGVKEGDTITQEEADHLLLEEMKEYEGYDIEGLLSVIKELEAVNDILWEYIWEKDMEEIRDRMEKLDL